MRRQRGRWIDIDMNPDVQFHLSGYVLPPNSYANRTLDLRMIYGNLRRGRYRISKEISKRSNRRETLNIMVEFRL